MLTWPVTLKRSLAVGTDYILTKNVSLNVDLSLLNIGDVSSGNTRTLVSTGTEQAIGAYKFEDIWIRTLTMGLKYRF